MVRQSEEPEADDDRGGRNPGGAAQRGEGVVGSSQPATQGEGRNEEASGKEGHAQRMVPEREQYFSGPRGLQAPPHAAAGAGDPCEETEKAGQPCGPELGCHETRGKNERRDDGGPVRRGRL